MKQRTRGASPQYHPSTTPIYTPVPTPRPFTPVTSQPPQRIEEAEILDEYHLYWMQRNAQAPSTLHATQGSTLRHAAQRKGYPIWHPRNVAGILLFMVYYILAMLFQLLRLTLQFPLHLIARSQHPHSPKGNTGTGNINITNVVERGTGTGNINITNIVK